MVAGRWSHSDGRVRRWEMPAASVASVDSVVELWSGSTDGRACEMAPAADLAPTVNVGFFHWWNPRGSRGPVACRCYRLPGANSHIRSFYNHRLIAFHKSCHVLRNSAGTTTNNKRGPLFLIKILWKWEKEKPDNYKVSVNSWTDTIKIETF